MPRSSSIASRVTSASIRRFGATAVAVLLIAQCTSGVAGAQLESGLVHFTLKRGGYRGDNIGMFTYNDLGERGHISVDSFTYKFGSP